MKFVLPVIGVFALVGVTSAMILSRSGLEAALPENVSVSGGAIEDGRLVMAEPTMSGFTGTNKPYVFKATRAIQDLTGGGPIELETVFAEVEMDNGTKATLKSSRGYFSPDDNTLRLAEGVRLDMSDGTSMEFTDADIDIDGSSFQTEKPVKVIVQDMQISADSMRANEGGKQLMFENRVKVTLDPKGREVVTQAESIN